MQNGQTVGDPATCGPPVGDETITRIAYGNWLFARLPPGLVDGLTGEQRDAIHSALTEPGAVRPPVNIRIGVPFFDRKFFLTVIGGEEKRSPTRQAHERAHYPLRTMANTFFIVGLATMFYILAVFAVALQSAILEP